MKLNFSQVKKIQLVCCGQGFNREYQGHYNRYKVLINSKPIENLFTAEELKGLSYWVNASKVMAMSIWGTSQEFEAELALGSFLKAQKEDEGWSEYCQRLRSKIQVIY